MTLKSLLVVCLTQFALSAQVSPLGALDQTHNPVAALKSALSHLDNVEAVSIQKRPDGNLDVYLRHKTGSSERLFMSQGMFQGRSVSWGSEVWFTLYATGDGIGLDNIHNASVTVSGPLRNRTGTTVRLFISLDGNRQPYLRSENVFRGPLGRMQTRVSVLNQANLPDNELLGLLTRQPDALSAISDGIRALSQFDQVTVARRKDGKLDITIEGNTHNRIDLNRPMAGVTVKSIELGKKLSFSLSQDGAVTRIDDVQNVSIKVNALWSDWTVQVKRVQIEEQKQGDPVVKLEVTNPFAPDKTMTIVVPKEELTELTKSIAPGTKPKP